VELLFLIHLILCIFIQNTYTCLKSAGQGFRIKRAQFMQKFSRAPSRDSAGCKRARASPRRTFNG